MAKSELLHTPIGKVKFTKTVINETEYRSLYVPPGYDANDKSNKSIWSFTLTLDPKDEKVKQLMALLDEEHKKIKGANFVPYKADKSKDQETGELKDTGLIAVNFRSGYPPVMFDSLKKKLSGIYVGWGSKVKVAFTVKPVNKKGKVGLGRYVKALQILEISQGSGDYGFEEEGDYATAGVGTGEGEQTEAWEE